MHNGVSKALVALVATLAVAIGAHAGHHETEEQRDIVDVAVAAGGFDTLAAALEAADLVSTLKGEGPFTVFAPTDEAFARLPAGTLEHLLKPENLNQLTAILTYHVVPGEVPASKLVTLDSVATLNGAKITIRTSDAGVSVDDARVTRTDVGASNGLIHVIDTVILPR